VDESIIRLSPNRVLHKKFDELDFESFLARTKTGIDHQQVLRGWNKK